MTEKCLLEFLVVDHGSVDQPTYARPPLLIGQEDAEGNSDGTRGQGRGGGKGLGRKGNQHAARLAAEARQALEVTSFLCRSRNLCLASAVASKGAWERVEATEYTGLCCAVGHNGRSHRRRKES